MKKRLLIILLAVVSVLSSNAQRAMNRPYVDDKLIHFGFSLGMNFMSYYVTESELPVDIPASSDNPAYHGVIHPRVSSLLPGFSVGFIADIRLARYLNLRFTPELLFAERTINYRYYKDDKKEVNYYSRIRCIPFSVPLMLKWSADRESNYRPYIVAGGGFSYDFENDKTRAVLQKPLNYFMQVGFGCDFYFSWFKFCPELKYQIGFNDVLMSIPERDKNGCLPMNGTDDYFYTQSISHLRSHMISLIFNFE